ncbi:hypothetical protein CUMW_272250 [Citrus unshiu]|uniref:Uncharacterized protein n=2 Tax=Citrus TaxID=2706 RepID=A0A067DC61_CITSI|nr:hypothetical protein CISIN_1g039169mg [Citrus sinensis]GAY31806.1 hypothetical protein CUMW_272250 [Citrus unshiu]
MGKIPDLGREMLLFNAIDPFKTKKLFTLVEVVGITPAIESVCAIDSVVVISTVFGLEGITRLCLPTFSFLYPIRPEREEIRKEGIGGIAQRNSRYGDCSIKIRGRRLSLSLPLVKRRLWTRERVRNEQGAEENEA